MNDELYLRAIKELARAGHGAGLLAAPTARTAQDNPLCGDRITLDVGVAGGRIVGIGHETRGCLLCQAAASLIGREAPGRTIAELRAADSEITAVLHSGSQVVGHWPDLAVFLPVAAHPSRHGCVMLPFRALRTVLTSATGG